MEAGAGGARAFALIVNPAAGGGRGEGRGAQAEALLAALGHDVVRWRTASLDDAARLAQTAAEDGRVAVAVGGDGLVGRVAAAVAATGGVLGVVPAGRGNDGARCLGIPVQLQRACGLLAGGTPRRVDLGEVGGRRYLTIASAGIDSAVNVIADRARFVRGPAVYPYATVRALASWRPARFAVDADGRRSEYTGYSFAAANGTSYGGGLVLAPSARVDDALLDVVTIGHSPKRHVLRVFPRMYRGTQVTDPSVVIARAPTVTVDADSPFTVYADGEPATTLPATFTALPAALRVLAP